MKDLTFNQAFKKFKFLVVKYGVRLCLKESKNKWARPESDSELIDEKKVFLYFRPEHKDNDYVVAPTWRELVMLAEVKIKKVLQEGPQEIPY